MVTFDSLELPSPELGETDQYMHDTKIDVMMDGSLIVSHTESNVILSTLSFKFISEEKKLEIEQFFNSNGPIFLYTDHWGVQWWCEILDDITFTSMGIRDYYEFVLSLSKWRL